MPHPAVSLRRVRAEDLDTLFEHQSDPESARMAMVVPRPREKFDAIWHAALADPNSNARAILLDGALVGAIGAHRSDGVDAVGYSVGRPYWGRGIATRALALLLQEVTLRPLHACAAVSNTASHRILIANGFTLTHTKHEEATERYIACEVAHYLLS